MPTKHKSTRFFERSYELTGKLPGKLFDPTEQKYITAKASDVSTRGLGLVTDSPLIRGQILWLILEDNYIKLEVTNTRRDEHGLYRAGLTQKGSTRNLEAVFAKYNCLEHTGQD